MKLTKYSIYQSARCNMDQAADFNDDFSSTGDKQCWIFGSAACTCELINKNGL